MMNRTTELYVQASTAIRAFFDPEDGAAMVEYAFLIALIAVVAVAAVALFGTALSEEFDEIASEVDKANG